MFTEEEIDLLLKSLDNLETITNNAYKAYLNHPIVQMFSESHSEFLAKQISEQKLTRERIILLKAKLVQLKDKNFINDLD